MKYCRFLIKDVPSYGLVEERGGVARIVAAATEFEGLATAASLAVPMELDKARLLPAVTPTKIVCVGRNYREHAAELGNDVPKEPLLFLKPPSSLLEHGGKIWKPAMTTRLDFEGELGVVIGKRASRIGENEDVRQYVRGYTVVNDVTMRDIQKADGQWTRGKGFDTSCPVGPVVSDEIDPMSEPVVVESYLNGERRQRGETRDLIFGIGELLRYVTAVMTLEVGDLIPTGTPTGVGPMVEGDVIEVTIGGIGTLRNVVGQKFPR